MTNREFCEKNEQAKILPEKFQSHFKFVKKEYCSMK